MVARRAHNPKVVGSNPSSATMVPWCSGYHVCLSRRRSPVRIRSEPPFNFGSVAQSVEQGTENPCVGGSIPLGATIFNYHKVFFFAIIINSAIYKNSLKIFIHNKKVQIEPFLIINFSTKTICCISYAFNFVICNTNRSIFISSN